LFVPLVGLIDFFVIRSILKRLAIIKAVGKLKRRIKFYKLAAIKLRFGYKNFINV
jgi:hypothetical protein